MADWPAISQAAAQSEGWDIFEASGSIQNENGDRPFQLQALDESDIFAGNMRDMKAWEHVYTQAMAGSLLHQQVLNFLREESPGEFEAIINECSPNGCELNEEFQWPLL